MTQKTSNVKAAQNRGHKKKIILVVIAILVLATIGIVALLVPRGPQKTISTEVNRAITTSPVGQTVDRIVPKGQLISTMVMPAGAKWWRILGSYTHQRNLQEISYAKLGQPTSFGLAVLYNYQSSDALYLANPATFLTYKTVNEATAVEQKLTAERTSFTNYYIYRLGTNIIILNNGSYADRVFILKNYKPVTQTATLTAAYWHIDWTTLGKYSASVQDAEYESVYAKVLGYAGVVNPQADAYWDGKSTDGTHWYGENNTANNKPVFNPIAVDPSKILSTIVNTQRSIKLVTPDGQETDYGVVDERQSAAQSYVSVATKSAAAGTVTVNQVGVKTKKLSADSDLVVATINPNAWFQYMFRDTSDAYALFGYERLAITLNTKSNTMNMTFDHPIAESK